MTVGIGIGVNIIGIQQGRNALGRFDEKMSAREMTAAVREASQDSLTNMRTKMRATWDQGSGELASTLDVRVYENEDNGATLEFTIGDLPHLQFVSSLGGDYKPGRYMIYPVEAKRLTFFWKRKGRDVALKYVQHPGFPDDVIVRASMEEAEELTITAYNKFLAEYAESFGV